MFCRVAILDKPLGPLSYRCIEGVRPGSIVQVPLRNRSYTALVLSLSEEAPELSQRIRKVIELVELGPVLSPAMIESLEFMSHYYLAPLGDCLRLALPKAWLRAGHCLYQLSAKAEEALAAWRAGREPELALLLEGAGGEKVPAQLRFQTEPAEESCRSLSASPLGRLLGYLEGAKLASAQTLMKEAQLSAKDIESFEASLYLEPKWQLERARLEEPSEQRYRALGVTVKRKLGSRQAALLAEIEAAGAKGLPYQSLLASHGSCLEALRRLEALGLIEASTEMKWQSNEALETEDCAFELSDEQRLALEAIDAAEGYRGFLLHGVTGSGKTEVYMHAMARRLERGGACLLVLPEIALTPQFCKLFQRRFGALVAVLHSALSESARFESWQGLRSGRLRIAIGARSALFAPIPKLAMIVIDEEHDSSFKQESTPRYHARDMALYLGKAANCPVILGSATPSLESYRLAMMGRLSYLRLTRRPLASTLPKLSLIDMRLQSPLDIDERLPEAERQYQSLKHRLFSSELLLALRACLERQEQALIFINRRGHATFIQCHYCGHVMHCPHCDVSLTHHRYAQLLRCHYCDHAENLPKACPRCRRAELNYLGFGTERIVEILQRELGPQARIDRLDRDRASAKGIAQILENFREGQIDILIGTQMLAKGHDIHNVTLVGVISADMSLKFPDFRAAERSFQLLTQVAGRAGRGKQSGQVLIQTLLPEHPVLQQVLTGDYEGFVKMELEFRKALQYPPLLAMALIRIESEDPLLAERTAFDIKSRLLRYRSPNAEVLGPALAPIALLLGRTRFQILIKDSKRSLLHACLSQTQGEMALLKGLDKVLIIYDVDPIQLL